MHLRETPGMCIMLAMMLTLPASAAVNINRSSPAVTDTPENQLVEQTVVPANTVANYELRYTAEHSADGSRVLSESWG